MCKNSNGRKPTTEYLSLYLPFTQKYNYAKWLVT